MDTKNTKEVTDMSYVDGYRDRRLNPTKGVTSMKDAAKKKLEVLKKHIK